MSKECCEDALDACLDARAFRALADPNRIALLCRLAGCGRACGVTELSACCAVDLSVVSRHLACLHDAGLIERTKEGREVRYSVRCSELALAFRGIADALDRCCTSRSQPTGA